jgi:hypothetical protein
MLSLMLAATHMSGAAAGVDSAGAWATNNSMAGMAPSAGQPVMMMQLQGQSGLAQHVHSSASFPASINGIQSAMMSLPS